MGSLIRVLGHPSRLDCNNRALSECRNFQTFQSFKVAAIVAWKVPLLSYPQAVNLVFTETTFSRLFVFHPFTE